VRALFVLAGIALTLAATPDAPEDEEKLAARDLFTMQPTWWCPSNALRAFLVRKPDDVKDESKLKEICMVVAVAGLCYVDYGPRVLTGWQKRIAANCTATSKGNKLHSLPSISGAAQYEYHLKNDIWSTESKLAASPDGQQACSDLMNYLQSSFLDPVHAMLHKSILPLKRRGTASLASLLNYCPDSSTLSYYKPGNDAKSDPGKPQKRHLDDKRSSGCWNAVSLMYAPREGPQAAVRASPTRFVNMHALGMDTWSKAVCSTNIYAKMRSAARQMKGNPFAPWAPLLPAYEISHNLVGFFCGGRIVHWGTEEAFDLDGERANRHMQFFNWSVKPIDGGDQFPLEHYLFGDEYAPSHFLHPRPPATKRCATEARREPRR
jgi:hypothetical protein